MPKLPSFPRKPINAYNDYRGGENLDSAPDNLADNEMMRAINVDLNTRGGWDYRPGIERVNASSYSAQVEQLFEWLKADGTIQLMAVIGKDMCKIAEDGTKTVVQALNASSNRKCFWFAFQSSLYFGDGYKYFVYNGSSCSEVSAASGADLTAIKRCKYAVWHPKSYCFIFAGDSSDPSAIYFSEPNEPNNVKAISKLYPVHGMGAINGLKVFGDAVVVGYTYGARIWRGIDPSVDVIWDEIPIPQGFVSNDSAFLTPGSLSYLGSGGFYTLPPSILNYTETTIAGQDMIPNRALGKQTVTIESITNPSIASAVFDPQGYKAMIAYTDVASATRNSKVLVYFWGIGGFTRYTGWAVNDFCLRRNYDLLFAGNNYIYRTKQGLSDAGTSIDYDVHTKKYNLSAPDHIKSVGKVFVSAAQKTNPSNVTIKIVSENGSATFTEIDLNTTSSWTGTWGGKWGGAELNRRELKLAPKLKGARFQVQYSGSYSDREATIYGHAFEYRVKRAKATRIMQD